MSRHTESHVTCDSCGRDGGHSRTPSEAVRQVRLLGWCKFKLTRPLLSSLPNIIVDLCDKCAKTESAYSMRKKLGYGNGKP